MEKAGILGQRILKLIFKLHVKVSTGFIWLGIVRMRLSTVLRRHTVQSYLQTMHRWIHLSSSVFLGLCETRTHIFSMHEC
jgi:hypothetical protein